MDGGVLVFGVQASGAGKQNPDTVQGVPGVVNLGQAHKLLDARAAGLTDPQVPGVRILPVLNPQEADAGVLAMFFPYSEVGPHQIALKSSKEVGRYYIRTSTNSTPAPHSILAALFGRPPPPILRLAVSRSKTGPLYVFVTNIGRRVSESVLLRVKIEPVGRTANLFDQQIDVPCWTRRTRVIHRDQPDYSMAVALDSGLLICPDDLSRALTLQPVEVRERVRVFARIDARGAMPAHFEAEVQLDGETLVPVPSVGDTVVDFPA